MNLIDLKNDYLGIGPAETIPVVGAYTGGQAVHVAKNTGLVFIKERRPPSLIAQAWSDEMFGNKISETSYTARNPIMKSRHVFIAEFADSVIQLRGKNLVDFGAGEGQFLEIVRKEYGALPFGVEPSKKNIALMKKQDIKSFEGTIEEFSASSESKNYDVVTLMWTLCNVGNCFEVMRAAFDSLKEGGHIVVSESSRILVPFKKPLNEYFSPKVRLDLHPWHFSFNTLSTLMELVGFEVLTSNRYLGQDNLVVIAQKKSKPQCRYNVDDYKKVLDFFQRWDLESKFYL